MDEQAEGIIVRVRLLTESSLIVHWITPQAGRIATVAKGARRPASLFHGKLDLFYQGNLFFRRQLRRDLHLLREVTINEFNPHLRTNVRFLQQACYFTRLIEEATETETPLPEIYQIFVNAVGSLPAIASPQLAVFAVEIQLLNELGLAPNWDETVLGADCRAILQRISDPNAAKWGNLRLSSNQDGEIRQFLDRFITFHLGRVPSGRNEALAEA